MIEWFGNWARCKECGDDKFFVYANGSVSCVREGHITRHYKLKKSKNKQSDACLTEAKKQ